MPRALVALGLLVLSTPFLPSAELSAQGDDAARIVPTDTAVLVRLESAQAWNELVHAFAPLSGESAASFDLQKWLDGNASYEADPATLPRLDPARPLYLALSFDPAGGPSVSVALPVSNGQPFQIHETFGTTTSAVVGSYAAVTNRPEFVASTTPSALFSALRPGVVSVRVDLAAIIATLRPLIEMGLSQAEAALDQLPSEDMSFDVQPLMETYLEGARALMDSARSLDLALERRGEQLSLRMDYSAKEESAPGAQAAAAVAVTDVLPMLGLIDPASPVQMAFNGKWTDYLERFEDFLEAALEAYPEPLRADMERMLDQQSALDALLAPGLVTGFDLGPAGMRGAYFARATEPEQLLAKLEEMMRIMDHEGGLVRIGPAERLPMDGLEVRMVTVEFRHEALFALLEEASQDAEGQEELEAEEFREALQTIYGENLRMALARHGELVAVCFGNNESELRASLARLAAPALPEPKMLALLANLEPGAIGFAYHFDFGRFAGRLADVLQVLAPEATFFPDLDASMDFWGSVRGATWSGGMTMSLSELIAFAQEMEAMDGK